MKTHIERVKSALDFVTPNTIDELAELIRKAPMIAVAGNGGSASIAIHLVTDLNALGYNAIDLLGPARITRIMNDIGAQFVFSEQVKTLPPDTLVILFSCSGTSPDIETVLREHDNTVLITSMLYTGSASRRCYRVMSSDYEVSEDVFSVICHAIKKALKQ